MGFVGSESTTLPTIAGLLMMITVPGIVIAYMATKMPQYVKPVGLIFIFAIGLGITVFFGFGILGPTGYLLPEVVEEAVEEIVQEVPEGKIFAISILAGSAEQGWRHCADVRRLPWPPRRRAAVAEGRSAHRPARQERRHGTAAGGGGASHCHRAASP